MPAGRYSLTGTATPGDLFTAYTEPTMRREILKALRVAKQQYPLGTCDDVVGIELGIPAEWVYTVRCGQALPDEPVPETYYTLLHARTKPVGRPPSSTPRVSRNRRVLGDPTATNLYNVVAVFTTSNVKTIPVVAFGPTLAAITALTSLVNDDPIASITVVPSDAVIEQ